MKRIIEGATYNTETATEIATGSFDDDQTGTLTDATLYQTRSGVYFNVDKFTSQRRARNGEVQEHIAYEWEVVGNAARAQEWCEKYELTITRDIEDMPDEAELGEKLATIYVRLPPALKDAITERAAAKKVSTNVFTLRCLEECEERNRGPNAFWNSVGALEQFVVDPTAAWERFKGDNVEGWKEYSSGWREHHRQILDNLIKNLTSIRATFPG